MSTLLAGVPNRKAARRMGGSGERGRPFPSPPCKAVWMALDIRDFSSSSPMVDSSKTSWANVCAWCTWAWCMVWPCPLPTTDAGRSAVMLRSGMRAWNASASAGPWLIAGRARGANDRHRRPSRQCHAKGVMGRSPFVDADANLNVGVAVEGEHERRVPRTRDSPPRASRHAGQGRLQPPPLPDENCSRPCCEGTRRSTEKGWREALELCFGL